MDLVVSSLKTPVGEFYMVIDDKTVVQAGFGTVPKHKKTENHPYAKLVESYFKGDKNALSKIPYAQSSTDFSQKTWTAIAKIPYGKTINYKDLAEKTGYKKAVRATGTACGKNNIVLIVPCHRVIKSDGSLGKYAYRVRIKQSLLDLEAGR